MREIEVPLPTGVDAESVEGSLVLACEELGLRVGLSSTLAGYPDSLHWHLTRGKERGTLEVTFVPDPARLWFAVHANREGAWIDEGIVRITDHFARDLPI